MPVTQVSPRVANIRHIPMHCQQGRIKYLQNTIKIQSIEYGEYRRKSREAKAFYFLNVSTPLTWSLSSAWLAGQVEVVTHRWRWWLTSTVHPAHIMPFYEQARALRDFAMVHKLKFPSQSTKGFDVRNKPRKIYKNGPQVPAPSGVWDSTVMMQMGTTFGMERKSDPPESN